MTERVFFRPPLSLLTTCRGRKAPSTGTVVVGQATKCHQYPFRVRRPPPGCARPFRVIPVSVDPAYLHRSGLPEALPGRARLDHGACLVCGMIFVTGCQRHERASCCGVRHPARCRRTIDAKVVKSADHPPSGPSTVPFPADRIGLLWSRGEGQLSWRSGIR